MRLQLFLFALVGNLLLAAAVLENAELAQGSLCFTFLSTYLGPVYTWAASLDPVESSAIINSNQPSASIEVLPTVDTTDSSSIRSPGLPTDGEDVPTADLSASDLSTGATVSREASGTVTSNAVFTTSGSAGVSGQGIILLVDESEETRKRQQRVIRGFVNNGGAAGSGSCSGAGVFSLSARQLFDGGDLIYYASEDFKQLAGQGEPPIDAITRAFVKSGGTLLFENPLLPNGEAGYCQDPETSEVFITFASAPPGCVPVSLTVYLVEQCQNGQIIDAGTSSVTNTLSLRSTISNESLSAASTRSTEATMLSSFEGLPSFSITEGSTTITSVTEVESSGTLSSTEKLIEDSSSSSPDQTATNTSTERPVPEIFRVEDTFTPTFISSEATSLETTTSEAVFSATSEVTSSQEFIASEMTTESTIPETCGGPLTTLALAQPTNLYQCDIAWNDETMAVTLPFPIGIGILRDTFVHVSPNGLLSLFGPSEDPENKDLPDEGLPDIAVFPIWDDLYFITARGHGVFYEVYPSTQGGREVTFEWIGYSVLGDGTYHFAATFYENFPSRLNFKYYTTGDKGSSATIGIQRRSGDDPYYIPKWSFNTPGAVQDGTTLTLDTQQSSLFTRGTFDNTACGKPEEPTP